MIITLQIVHVILCMFLIGIVLIQTGKGQGLSGAFGSVAGDTAQNMFGARTGDVLTKVTTYLAVGFFVLALVLAVLQSRASESVLINYEAVETLKETVAEEVPPVASPATPTTVTETETPASQTDAGEEVPTDTETQEAA